MMMKKKNTTTATTSPVAHHKQRAEEQQQTHREQHHTGKDEQASSTRTAHGTRGSKLAGGSGAPRLRVRELQSFTRDEKLLFGLEFLDLSKIEFWGCPPGTSPC